MSDNDGRGKRITLEVGDDLNEWIEAQAVAHEKKERTPGAPGRVSAFIRDTLDKIRLEQPVELRSVSAQTVRYGRWFLDLDADVRTAFVVLGQAARKELRGRDLFAAAEEIRRRTGLDIRAAKGKPHKRGGRASRPRGKKKPAPETE